MSSIVKQKNGKHTYLYESVSYRNENGQPRNRRTIIGKINPSGETVYKTEYVERMAQNNTPVQVGNHISEFSINQIKQSSLKEYGAFYLFKSIAEKTGLLSILRNTFITNWDKIFALCCYLVSSGEPLMYFNDWLDKTESAFSGSLSSQRISELLASITVSERMDFFKQWGACRSEQEYLALDITSISSYSELINDVEWGYNRDGDNLPQINVCLLFGEKSGLPVFQTVYSGSLKDVSTLRTTLKQASSISTDKLLIVMDKGFCSTKNINAMLDEQEKIRFIIAAPFTMNFIKKQIQSEKKDIDQLQNIIVLGEDTLRGICKERSWQNGKKLFVHVFFNVKKATDIRENLYAHVTLLKDEAEKNPNNTKYQTEFKRYLCIRKSEKDSSGATVNIRQDVIGKELEHAGWLVILSNDVSNPKEAISIYRTKDVVEKGFQRFKNSMDMDRLRIHSDNRMQNKVFLGFIGLIIIAGIHKTMLEHGLYKTMTMKKMIKTLDKIRIQRIDGVDIIFPITKEQRSIFEVFGLQEPM